jgi:nucleoside phosphorylase
MTWILHNHRIAVVSAIYEETDLILKEKPIIAKKALGIGNLEAGLALDHLIESLPELEAVLYLGSAGAYAWSTLTIGDFVFSDDFSSLSIASALGLSKQIQAEKIHQTNRDFFSKSHLVSRDWKEAITNAPAEITLHQIQKPPIPEWQEFNIENMETFGVATVCKKRNLPLLALFCVTNIVGPDGSEQWKNNWRKFSNEIQHELQQILKK